MRGNSRGQIALEFIVVYSLVLIIFVLVFSVISSQRATTINAQASSIAGIEAQEIASYIDHAISAGSGYTATLSLAAGPSSTPYGIYVSTSGAVIVNSTAGGQPVSAYAFSDARNLSINGSLQYGSSSGGIYAVPSYTGTITISNVDGIIYIDRAPVSEAGLLGNPILASVQESYVPKFNGVNGEVVVPSSASLDSMSNGMTACAWTYVSGLPPSGHYEEVLVKARNSGDTNTEQFEIRIPSSNNFQFLLSNGAGSYIGHPSTGTISADTWYFICGTYNYSGGSTYMYLNGIPGAEGIPSGPLVDQPSIPFTIGQAEQPSTGSVVSFNGFISDVQIYNSSLSSNQVMALYEEGIGGLPVRPSSLIGWWPLNGNGNDYSGNANNGQYSNLSFMTLGQLSLDVLARSGQPLTNNLISFVVNNGIANGGPAGQGLSYNGMFNAFVVYNRSNVNASVFAFNGNISASNSLVGWWPLARGEASGNTLYDLSGGNDNAVGIFVTSGGGGPVTTTSANVLWNPSSLSRHFTAAMFPGNTAVIDVSNQGSLNNITSRNNLTLVGWVKYSGGSTAGCAGIFGSGGSTGTGVQLNAKIPGSSCSLVSVGTWNSPTASVYPIPFNSLNWTMVSMVWSGASNSLAVFENTSLAYSNSITVGGGISPSSSYYIGAENSIGGHAFNGLISNIQLYSRALSPQQITQLYSQGPTGLPLTGGGLSAWWPLSGNANDYSGGNAGTLQYNALFGSSNYTFSYPGSSASAVATFNGLTGIKIPTGGTMPFNGPFSISIWFNSYNSPLTPFDYELLDAQQPNGNGIDIQLCGGGSTGPCSLTGLHGDVGSGTGTLSSTVNYNFNFSSHRSYSLVETFASTGSSAKAWTIYVDGVNVSSGSYSGTPAIAGSLTSPNYLELGGGKLLNSYFYGQLADVQVYNAVLTPAEALQIYQQGISPQRSVNLSLG